MKPVSVRCSLKCYVLITFSLDSLISMDLWREEENCQDGKRSGLGWVSMTSTQCLFYCVASNDRVNIIFTIIFANNCPSPTSSSNLLGYFKLKLKLTL